MHCLNRHRPLWLVPPLCQVLAQQPHQLVGFSQIDIVQWHADFEIADPLDVIVDSGSAIADDAGDTEAGKFNDRCSRRRGSRRRGSACNRWYR